MVCFQAPYNLRIAFGSEIQEASNEAAELVRILGRDISSMKWSLKNSHIKRVHNSTERLQSSMQLHSYLLTATSESPARDNPSKHLPKLSHTHSSTLCHLPDQMGSDELKYPEKNANPLSQSIPLGTMPPEQTESYHEIMRKQLRRLYSWPSREVDAYEEDSGTDFLPRMRALESTAALSLANFTSSLVEFVARVDHLIEAVDKLSKMAKFKPDRL